MAETKILTRSIIEDYKNSKYQLTTELKQIYVCPPTVKASIIILCHVANVDPEGDTDCAITIGWSDYSDDDFITYLLYNTNLPARSGLNVLGNKLFLEPLDAIYAKAILLDEESLLDRAHLTLSVLEIT
jgi:hypothetical protein